VTLAASHFICWKESLWTVGRGLGCPCRKVKYGIMEAEHVALMGEERGCIRSWWGNRRE